MKEVLKLNPEVKARVPAGSVVAALEQMHDDEEQSAPKIKYTNHRTGAQQELVRIAFVSNNSFADFVQEVLQDSQSK